MNKKLLAIAIAGIVAAPSSSFADATLFGQAHGSIDYLDNDDESSIGASNNSSRIGVKGSMDLGGDLAAIYHMEWGVNLTDTSGTLKGDGTEVTQKPGSKTLSARNRYVGLSGGFGTAVIGRHDTPFKTIGRKVDLFWSTQLGQNRSFTNNPDGDSPAGWDFRADNVLGYISPDFGGFHVFAAYVTDHDLAATAGFPISDNNDFDAFSVVGIYENKDMGLYVAAGYEQHNVELPGVEDSEDAIRVTAKYDMSNGFTLAGFYQTANDQSFVKGADRDVYGGGLAYTAGSNTFKGQVYLADDLGDANDTGALLYSLGIDHAYSKSTAIYAQIASLDNDANSTIALGGSGHGDSAKGKGDETTLGVSTGIRVKF